MQDDMIFNCGIENGAQRLQRLGLHGSAVLTQVRHDSADMYRLDVAHTHCGELGHDIAVEDVEQILSAVLSELRALVGVEPELREVVSVISTPAPISSRACWYFWSNSSFVAARRYLRFPFGSVMVFV